MGFSCVVCWYAFGCSAGGPSGTGVHRDTIVQSVHARYPNVLVDDIQRAITALEKHVSARGPLELGCFDCLFGWSGSLTLVLAAFLSFSLPAPERYQLVGYAAELCVVQSCCSSGSGAAADAEAGEVRMRRWESRSLTCPVLIQPRLVSPSFSDRRRVRASRHERCCRCPRSYATPSCLCPGRIPVRSSSLEAPGALRVAQRPHRRPTDGPAARCCVFRGSRFSSLAALRSRLELSGRVRGVRPHSSR